MSKLKHISLMLALAFVFSIINMPKAYATISGTNPLKSVKTPTSTESKLNFKIKLHGENLSKEEDELMSQLAPLLSHLTLNIEMKSKSNAENTIADIYLKASTSLMGIPFTAEVWMKYNTTVSPTSFSMIIKLPKSLEILPEGKEYIVIDSEDLGLDVAATPSAFSASEMTDLSIKMKNVVFTLLEDLDAKFNLIGDKGEVVINTPAGNQTAHAYELKLDDKSFKDVLNYTVNTLLQNKEFVTLIEDVTKILSTTDKDAKLTMDADIARTIKEFNKFFESFKDIKFIGDKGIVYNYAISPDNYLVSQKGLFDIVLDMQSLSKIPGTSELPSGNSTPQGKYFLTIEFENINYNINKIDGIGYPTINKSNSLALTELMEAMFMGLDTKTIPAGKKPTSTVKKPVPAPKKVVTKPTAKKPVVVKKPVTTKKPATKKPVIKKPVGAKKPTVTKKPTTVPAAKKPLTTKKK